LNMCEEGDGSDSDNEPTPPHMLQARFFPSKFGGEPAWLIPEHFPRADSMRCDYCGHKLSFLLQLHASRGDADPACFLRALFVFLCRRCKDRHHSVKVLRAQLPRVNKYYSPEEPDEDNTTMDEAPSGAPECGPGYLPEYSIECEEESSDDEEGDSSSGSDDEDGFNDQVERRYAMDKYRVYLERMDRLGPEGEMDESEMRFFEEWRAKHCKPDAAFARFQRLTRRSPDQVVRYGDHAPVWYCDAHQLRIHDADGTTHSDDATGSSANAKLLCSSCGGPRTFEFQIMPQLISVLKLGDLEWGTIAIYTCAGNCESRDESVRYLEEYAYVQPETWMQDTDGQEVEIQGA